MTQHATVRVRQPEISELINNQKALIAALRTLFDLLESYAPVWYTEEHHNIAFAALERTKQIRSINRNR